MRTRTTLLTLPVTAAVTVGLTSCGLLSSGTTTATKDLEVGQCYNTVSKDSGGENAIGEVTVVDCSKAHTYEVIAQTTFGDDIKKLKKDADYLVEWDIPAEITMEQYLTRKKANAPKYAEVPEVSFLRTYVREDTAKCLCFYDAPDEDAVLRARKAVSTPIDRLFKLHA